MCYSENLDVNKTFKKKKKLFLWKLTLLPLSSSLGSLKSEKPGVEGNYAGYGVCTSYCNMYVAYVGQWLKVEEEMTERQFCLGKITDLKCFEYWMPIVQKCMWKTGLKLLLLLDSSFAF